MILLVASLFIARLVIVNIVEVENLPLLIIIDGLALLLFPCLDLPPLSHTTTLLPRSSLLLP